MAKQKRSKESYRQANAMRKTHGAGTGRPRSRKKRCACGAMTLKRAEARAHHCS